MNIINFLDELRRQDCKELRHQVLIKQKLEILEELFVIIEKLRSQSFSLESNLNDKLDCRAIPISDWAELELLADAYKELMKEYHGFKN